MITGSKKLIVFDDGINSSKSLCSNKFQEIHCDRRKKRKKTPLLDSTNLQILKSPDLNKKLIVQTVETKKLCISDEEKMMNGAPEGDLFDLTVLTDEQLQGFQSVEFQPNLEHIISTSTENLSWAELHEAITNIRRIILHQAIPLECQNVEKFIVFTVKSVNSLRSSNIKNGIQCLRNIFEQYYQSNLKCSNEAGDIVLNSLYNKIGGGPKFITELANDVMNIITTKISSAIIIKTSLAFVQHRNAEIASKALENISKSIQMIEEDHIDLVLLQSLIKGLNAKLPKGREASRHGIQNLFNTLGQFTFQDWIQQCQLLPSTQNEIFRIVHLQ